METTFNKNEYERLGNDMIVLSLLDTRQLMIIEYYRFNPGQGYKEQCRTVRYKSTFRLAHCLELSGG